MISSSHRTCVAINNLAVDLKDRQFDDEAFATLSDAVFAIQVVCNDSPHGTSEAAIHHVVEERMQGSVRRAARASTRRKGPPLVSVVDVLADDACYSSAATVERILRTCPIADGHLTFIRIESIEDDRDINIDQCIILHNYGLACLCQSLRTPSYVQRHDLQVLALRTLQLSQRLLGVGASQTNGDRTKLQKIVFLAVLSTAALAQVLYRSNAYQSLLPASAITEVLKCLVNLNDLKNAFRELGGVWIDSWFHRTSAAAAA